MPIFTVFSRHFDPDLTKAIEREFPREKDRYDFSSTAWLLSTTGTPSEIAEKLGVKKGGISGVVVMRSTNSYFGVASADLWDWIKARIEEEAE